ncbi:uncharacterized protein METZ01_LOCUS144512, partial [marine metagenome]
MAADADLTPVECTALASSPSFSELAQR